MISKTHPARSTPILVCFASVVSGERMVEETACGWRRPGRPNVFVEMTDDAVDDFGVGEDRDDLHFRTTCWTPEWIDLEDFSDQPCPAGPAG